MLYLLHGNKTNPPPEKQAAKPLAGRLKADARTTPVSLQTDFDVVLSLIAAARARAFVAVNTALIDLYWQIGEHISQRIAADRWGGNRRGPSRIHPETAAKRTGFLRPKPLANDAVLRNLPGRVKTVTTGERIELDP
jgi:hypothetical protein